MKEFTPSQLPKEQKIVANHHKKAHRIGGFEGTSALKNMDHDLNMPEVKEKETPSAEVFDFPQKEKVGFWEKHKKKVALTLAAAAVGSGVYVGSKLLGKSDSNSDINSGVKIETTVNPTQPSETGNNQVVVPATNETSPTTSTQESTPTSKPENKELLERLALAPEITGLNKQIQDKDNVGKIIYVAKAGNGYGIKEGDYAGEFKKEVMVENKEVGGVALVPEVAQKLLEDELAKIPEGEKKLRIIIPLDITTLDASKELKIFSANCTKVNIDSLIVEMDQPLNFVSTILGKNQFITSNNSISLPFRRHDGTEFTIENLGMIAPTVAFSEELNNENMFKHLLFNTGRESIPSDFTGEFSFGEKMGIEVNNNLAIICGSNKMASLSVSDLLSVGNSIVFSAVDTQ